MFFDWLWDTCSLMYRITPGLFLLYLLLLLHPFNGLFSWTTWISRHQKGNHSGFYWNKRWWGGSGISWTIFKSFAPRSRQTTTPVPPPLHPLQARCPSCHPTNSIKALKAQALFLLSICQRSTRRWYLIYSEADFEFFCPAGATRCTDGGEIWHRRAPKVPSSVPNFTPSVQQQGYRTPKLKVLLTFHQNVEYKRPTEAYPLCDFHCSLCPVSGCVSC